MCLSCRFFEDDFEVGEGGERVIRVPMTVTDLLRNGAENGMFGHPTRDSLDFAAASCRFLHDYSDSNMIARNGPSPRLSWTRSPIGCQSG